MSNFSFLQPAFGFLLLAIPLLWFFPRRVRSYTHAAIRSGVFALAIAALMQPVLMSQRAKEHHAIIIDQSASLSDSARATSTQVAEQVAALAQSKGGVTIVELGGTGGVESGVNDAVKTLRLPEDAGSPLGDALALGAQSIPFGVGGSVTVISDGMSTDRRWGRSVAQLIEREIPVHAYDLGASNTDAFLGSLNVSNARPGEMVRVGTDVIGDGKNLRIVLRQNDATLAESEPFDSEGRTHVVVEFEAEEVGFVDFTAELLVPGGVDSDVSNNILSGVAAIQDPLQVLYLSDLVGDPVARASELLGDGFEVSTVDPSALDADFNFAAYDIVILDDLPARQIDLEVQENISRAVREEGLGLMHSGGESAFGDGGYDGTPLGDLFPVSMSSEDEKSDPSVGLVLIVDSSGSMAGTRIELAKQIARIAVRRMQPHDRVGIVEFYGAKHWAIPLQSASNKIEIDRAIGRMQAIGGTVLFPAIQEAYYGLLNVNTRYKHVVMITDAGVEDDNYEGMLRQMAKDNINVSTILVGSSGHNMIMSDLANWGRGRFYSVADQFSLVELILKEPSTKKPPQYKSGIFEVKTNAGAGWFGDVDRADIPNLAGYVQVEPRDGAEVLLELSGAGHPLLTSWRYGLGRVTTFMSEPFGAGTSDWRNWDDYGELLSRVTARTANDGMPYALSLTRRGDRLTLTANATDASNFVAPTAYRVDEAGERINEEAELFFVERAPGLFEADFAALADDAVRVEVVASGRKGLQRIADPARSDVFGETQVDPANALDLGALAARTGGIALHDTPEGDWALTAGSGELSFVMTRLWPFFLLAALALYLFDLVYRRWPSKRTRVHS